MKREFVPYELALRLKKLGFDEHCFGFHDDEGSIYFANVKERNALRGDKYSLAPTFRQVFRWFREKYSLLHELISVQENSWLITIVDLNSKSVNGVYMKRINLDDIDENVPRTYEEAELACLNKLLEIVEQTKK